MRRKRLKACCIPNADDLGSTDELRGRVLLNLMLPASCALSPLQLQTEDWKKIDILSAEHDQLSRMCRLNIVVQPRLAEHADMILRYDAFDSEGNQIATAFFAAMLEKR